MRSIIVLVRIWFATYLTVIATTFRRVVLGPSQPSWTWRTEWAVASARRVISIAADHREDRLMNRIGMRFTMPLPISLMGAVRVKRVGATSDTAMILYFHGGGYTFGNPGTHREHIARLVARTASAATAPPYRLAPRHPYPAAVDDAIAAYRALLDLVESSTDIVVAGDSAGGGLALAMVHRARAEGLSMPRGLLLFSPYTDLDHTGYTIRTNATTDYLPVREMSVPNDWYTTPDRHSDPEASPINADLTGFPPMLVFAGGAEMLYADSLRLVENAKRGGVECELVTEPEMPHVWPALAPWEPASKRALAKCAEWMGK